MLDLGLGPTRRAPRGRLAYVPPSRARCIDLHFFCCPWRFTMVDSGDKRPSHSRIATRFPCNEEHAIWPISVSFYKLDRYVADFESSLNLFDFCHDKLLPTPEGPQKHGLTRLRDWQLIAARDGAMTIFHFGMTMKGVKKSLDNLPLTRAMVSKPTLASARDNFRKFFPRFEALRHSVAHAGEKSTSRELLNKHAVRGQGTISNHLVGREFYNSWEGRTFSYELSRGTFCRLNSVRLEFQSAFSALWTYPEAKD
jgi:hypothetical protein